MRHATLKIIKKALVDADTSFAELAREADVTRSHLRRVAKGERRSRRLRALLCQRLHLNPRDLGWNGQNGRAA